MLVLVLNSENCAARQPQFFPVLVHHHSLIIRHSLLTGVCVCMCMCLRAPVQGCIAVDVACAWAGWQPGLAQCQPLQWQRTNRSSWVITARWATSRAIVDVCDLPATSLAQAFESLEFHQFGDKTFGPGQAERCSSRLQTYQHALAQKSADIHNLPGTCSMMCERHSKGRAPAIGMP